MTPELILDIVKIVMPSVIGYLVWITKTVLKQSGQLNCAFYKIRKLENELDREYDR